MYRNCICFMQLNTMLSRKFYFAIIFLTYFRKVPSLTNNFYSKFHQTDYKIDFQRLELIDYNKSVFNFIEIKTFKYNRTQPAVNITINSKVNLSNELEVAVQFYKFLSNEYRILPGSNFQINLCKSLAANIGGIQICYKCGNLTSCQLVQGTTYKICNAYPEESRFPPFLPTGEYRFQIDIKNTNDEIFALLSLYMKIYRPVRPLKNKTVY